MEDFYYEKIITISTLTAGIGVSSLGLNANHADAAEYNHNPAPQHNQFGQQGPHGQNMQFSHQQGQGYQQPQFKQQSNYNQSTTTSTTSDGSSSSSSSSTTTFLQLKLHLLHQVIYTQPANVLGMYMTELVVKSVVLGEMLITGRGSISMGTL